jgi:hypothetical protein
MCIYIYIYLRRRRRKSKENKLSALFSLCSSSAPPPLYTIISTNQSPCCTALHLLFTLTELLHSILLLVSLNPLFSLHSIVATNRRISTFILLLASDRRLDASCKNGTITQCLSCYELNHLISQMPMQ